MFNDYGGFEPDSSAVPETPAPISGRAKIKVIGVGGAGNNAVNRMLQADVSGAEYYVVNTDSQILALSRCKNKIQIGVNLTKGLGAGADPEIGRKAAEENIDELTKAVEDTDLLFITAGMGGGTGTGAAPIIAKIARDKKILTVAIVTEPFGFEGKRRMENTIKGIDNLKKYVDTLIVIPNDKIKEVIAENTSLPEALKVADDILRQSIKGLTELIVNPSLINLDFADVRTILKDKGVAHLGVGIAKGENRVIEAVRVAVLSPLLETTIEGARGVILNIVGGNDLTFEEVNAAAELVKSVVDASANIIFGARIDPNAHDEVEITIIATGFPGSSGKPAEETPRYRPSTPNSDVLGIPRRNDATIYPPVNESGVDNGLRRRLSEADNYNNGGYNNGGNNGGNGSAGYNAQPQVQPQYPPQYPPQQPQPQPPTERYDRPAENPAAPREQAQTPPTQETAPADEHIDRSESDSKLPLFVRIMKNMKRNNNGQ